jgi:hypothetical protein
LYAFLMFPSMLHAAPICSWFDLLIIEALWRVKIMVQMQYLERNLASSFPLISKQNIFSMKTVLMELGDLSGNWSRPLGAVRSLLVPCYNIVFIVVPWILHAQVPDIINLTAVCVNYKP